LKYFLGERKPDPMLSIVISVELFFLRRSRITLLNGTFFPETVRISTATSANRFPDAVKDAFSRDSSPRIDPEFLPRVGFVPGFRVSMTRAQSTPSTVSVPSDSTP
jgi:hypothetical protein